MILSIESEQTYFAIKGIIDYNATERLQLAFENEEPVLPIEIELTEVESDFITSAILKTEERLAGEREKITYKMEAYNSAYEEFKIIADCVKIETDLLDVSDAYEMVLFSN